MAVAAAEPDTPYRQAVMAAGFFGERLKQLRQERDWTQAELAARIGVKQNTISQFENGVIQPTWAMVIAFCKTLGVSCEEFREPPGWRPPKSEPPKKPRR